MEKDIARRLKICFGYGITEHGYFVTYDPLSGILVQNIFHVDLDGSSKIHLELRDNIEKETL